MHTKLIAGATSAAILIACFGAAPAMAADLGNVYGGSLKDLPMPVVTRSSAGPCYFRGDVGYSVSRNPDVTWPVFTELTEIFENIDPGETYSYEIGRNVTNTFIGDDVTNVEMDNTWLAEVGAGCGSGSRGFRGEIMFGFRGNRDVWGEPNVYSRTTITETNDQNSPLPPTRVTTGPGDLDDPLHTSIKSYTLMFNAYYDLGRFGSFVPYVGAGVGAAYHMVDEVYFTENPFLTNRIEGNKDISFAWSVMTGVGYQISDRAILDLGYRYIDMGKATSGRVDNAGFVNPRVTFDDLASHEFKVGLRYHFGGDRAPSYASLK